MINVFKYALTTFSHDFSGILRCVLVYMADDNSTEPYGLHPHSPEILVALLQMLEPEDQETKIFRNVRKYVTNDTA